MSDDLLDKCDAVIEDIYDIINSLCSEIYNDLRRAIESMEIAEEAYNRIMEMQDEIAGIARDGRIDWELQS